MQKKYFFIVGAPRSGTTWLQLMLSRHPDIGTCQETHLFDGYLGPMEHAWKQHEHNNRGIGIQAAVNRHAFLASQRNFALDVLNAISEKPVILEKTPAHVRHVHQIAEVLPEARFVHLIRDPRAVVNSLLAAGKTWGRNWASRDVVKNTRTWLTDVQKGVDFAQDHPENYLEIKYEELLSDTSRSLMKIFNWIGVSSDLSIYEDIIHNTNFEAIQQQTQGTPWDLTAEPDGFFRRGIADSWKSDLDWRQIAAIEDGAGQTMRSLGYVPITQGRGTLDRIRERCREGVAWRLARWNRRLNGL